MASKVIIKCVVIKLIVVLCGHHHHLGLSGVPNVSYSN